MNIWNSNLRYTAYRESAVWQANRPDAWAERSICVLSRVNIKIDMNSYIDPEWIQPSAAVNLARLDVYNIYRFCRRSNQYIYIQDYWPSRAPLDRLNWADLSPQTVSGFTVYLLAQHLLICIIPWHLPSSSSLTYVKYRMVTIYIHL